MTTFHREQPLLKNNGISHENISRHKNMVHHNRKYQQSTPHDYYRNINGNNTDFTKQTCNLSKIATVIEWQKQQQ